MALDSHRPMRRVHSFKTTLGDDRCTRQNADEEQDQGSGETLSPVARSLNSVTRADVPRIWPFTARQPSGSLRSFEMRILQKPARSEAPSRISTALGKPSA